MEIFELIMESTLGNLDETKETCEEFDNYFSDLDLDPEELDWDWVDTSDLDDPSIMWETCAANLMEAIQENDMIPADIDLNNFDYSDGISYMSTGEEDPDVINELERDLDVIKEKTGLVITIE